MPQTCSSLGAYGNGRLLGVHFAGNGVIELLGATLSQVHIPMMPHPCLFEIIQEIGLPITQAISYALNIEEELKKFRKKF